MVQNNLDCHVLFLKLEQLILNVSFHMVVRISIAMLEYLIADQVLYRLKCETHLLEAFFHNISLHEQQLRLFIMRCFLAHLDTLIGVDVLLKAFLCQSKQLTNRTSQQFLFLRMSQMQTYLHLAPQFLH